MKLRTMESEFALSVRLMTCNHEKYIDEAMSGILSQQTDFPFEIVIGDDFSTDRTLDILKSYKSTGKIKINILERPKGGLYFNNRKKFGRLYNFFNTLENCKGKYVALLDGDDYWTDPLKLQKQVDFLERNPDFSICFHNMKILKDEFPEKIKFSNHNQNETTDLDDLAKGSNYICTASCLFHNRLVDIPEWIYKIPFGDYALYLLTAKKGKIKFINEVMGVYRIHAGSIHGSYTNSAFGLIKAYKQHVLFWSTLKNKGVVENQQINNNILNAFQNILQNSLISKQYIIALQYNFLLFYKSGLKYRKKFIHNIFFILKGLVRRT